MVSKGLMVALLVQNILIAVFSLFEGNWVRALYWSGAAIINTAVVLGT